MNIGWPEGIILGLAAINFSVHCKRSGQPRGEFDPVVSLLDSAVFLGLLYWGGFFS